MSGPFRKEGREQATGFSETQTTKLTVDGVGGGKGQGKGVVREFGMDMSMLLYLEWMTNKDLLESAGNSV